MPNPTPDSPADLLRAAAEKLREEAARAHRASPGPWAVTDEHVVRCADGMIVAERSGTNHPAERGDLPHIALMHPGVGLALAAWLESWSGVDLSEHGPMPEDAQHALAVARQLLGTSAGEGAASSVGASAPRANTSGPSVAATLAAPPAPASAPLAEVWTVWREDEPIYAHCATVDDARQATIDCWQDDEPVCPDYSWRKDGPRLELVVGGEHSGVYASRHRVYAAPPAPADRAADDVRHRIARALEREDSVNWGYDHGFENRYGVDPETDAFVDAVLAVLAGEAAAGVQQTTEGEATLSYRLEHRHPGDATWQTGTPLHRGHWSWQSREKADQRLAEARDRWPDFEHRLIETTTTVTTTPAAPAAPPTHLPQGTNAEDCPACKGTNPPYPFLCPGPPAAPAAPEEPTPDRPRCPDCQMPHDLTPGSLPLTVCAGIRQRLADAARQHAAGDHGLCCRADCAAPAVPEERQ
ncbi:hypothetical protein YUYDRAFT_02113 [Streptomyces sp. ScaeMP-e48]|uniref:hypothetical protein n=1 Tax=Streptomyces sp. ScaeMP-e48 TaxID=1100823 RepID=UPI000823B51A|nr:hypothetical protein [Streptomyces sp. ScaeMP-e48]SCK20295.1 hypothetical protein YUYDRAFT_02113 [Streptomyces sp. ScaeMP-e48]